MNKFLDYTNIDESNNSNFDTYNKGDILASNGFTFESLPPGLNGRLLTCNSNRTLGVEWTSPTLIGGSGLTYLGVWNALTNQPDLLADDGIGGPYSPSDYFIINVAGLTLLNGISVWGVGDWVVRSSIDTWQKIDNSNHTGITRHSELTEIGTITHDQIDAHIMNNAIHFTLNDTTPSVTSTYSSNKIETALGTKTSINDSTPSNVNTYSSNKIDTVLGTKTSVNDSSPSNVNTYSSNKIETVLGTKTSINDTTPSATQTYSSNKIDTVLGTKSNSNHNHTLNSLSNVSISSLTSGDALRWDGLSSWVNSQRLFSSAGTGSSLIKSSVYDVTFKSIKDTTNSIIVTNNQDDLTFNVPKITSNSIQISDNTNGWSIKEATGSLSFAYNGLTKLVIPSNTSFLGGFPSGANVAGFLLPSGLTTQRANTAGTIRYNTTLNRIEYYNGAWIGPTENLSLSSVQGSDLNLTGQVANDMLMYNGTVWSPRAQGTLVTVGTGIATLKSTVLNGVSQLRSIKAGTNTTVALVGDDIEISATSGGGGEVNTAIGLGIGATIVGTKSGSVLGFKNILQGNGISVITDSTDLTINNTRNTLSSMTGDVAITGTPSDGSVLRYNNGLTKWEPSSHNMSSAGTGQSIIYTTTPGGSTAFKNILAGTNTTVTTVGGDLVVSATGGGGGGISAVSVDTACPQLAGTISNGTLFLSSRSSETIRIGLNSGLLPNSTFGNIGGVSIGDNCGKTTGVENLYFGPSAGGGVGTKSSGMALGILSGYNNLGARATIIGFQAGFNTTGDDSIAIGPYAGYSGTQPNTISIGNYANYTAPSGTCIVLNASGSALNGISGGFHVSPVANKNQQPEKLCYNSSTKEITYEKDFQLYRCTTAQRNSLSGLQPGCMIFNTETLQLDLWSGVAWRSI